MNTILKKIKIFGIRNLIRALYTEWIKRYLYLQPVLGTYSQDREDLILDKLLKYKSDGFYVDVGAFDPVRYNNTYKFYLKGWSGINIEPNLVRYQKFLKTRPRDISLNCGVGNTNAELIFYKFTPDSLSTFSKADAEKYRQSGFILECEEKVIVRKLSWVLNKFASNRKIDLLFVDAEGFDLNVLLSNNWKKFKPNIICIETFDVPGKYSQEAQQIFKLLLKQNYQKHSDIGFNTIF